MMDAYAEVLQCRPFRMMGVSGWAMSIVNEKRRGGDRRLTVGAPPSGIKERRVGERRQTIIADIPFSEWATHFDSFRQGVGTEGVEQSVTVPGTAANGKGGQ